MSFAAYWKKSKRQINRYRHTFELRVYGSGYCDFIIYNFYFVIPKTKMWIVKITGADGSFSGINYVANSFSILAYHYHLTLHCISILCKSFLRFKIIPDRITLKFVLPLCEMCPVNKITGAINALYCS